MNHYGRYAIYYAPRTDSRLWTLAAAWLGRDPQTQAPVARMPLQALEGHDLDRLTAAPRHYGFHATLMAPFEPAGDCEPDLLRCAETFAAERVSFAVGLEVAELGDFVALRPGGVADADALTGLHAACVRHFDRFRSPLDSAEIRRRRRNRLTAEQDAHLLRWGYPYVFENFRFHMTLTGRIANTPSRHRIRTVLGTMFTEALAVPVPIDGIAVYAQVNRETPFRLLEWFPFAETTQLRVALTVPSSASEQL